MSLQQRMHFSLQIKKQKAKDSLFFIFLLIQIVRSCPSPLHLFGILDNE